MKTALILCAIGIAFLIADRVHFHAKRFKFRKDKENEDSERRFDYLLVQLYSCLTWEHLKAFDGVMDRILTAEDRKSKRYDELIIEVEKMDAAITNDHIKMQNIRTKEGGQIISKIKF